VPDVTSFTIRGLAGRGDIVSHKLNPHVNIFFGPNGSGKTSLLRILHSALLNDASLLKTVPFEHAEVVLYSYGSQTTVKYTLSKEPDEGIVKEKSPARLKSALLRAGMEKLTWNTDSPETFPWIHRYLPISRLYEGPRVDVEASWAIGSRPETEESLESRFAENLRNTWKDYSAQIAYKVSQIQEAGLARILASVIARSESQIQSGPIDRRIAYEAVSNFLTRRGMNDIKMSPEEFYRRYRKDQRLRSLATDIEAVERQIAEAMAPREELKKLIREMFIGGKSLTLSEGGIDVELNGKSIGLSLLSSGEKQLLKILVDSVVAGSSILLIDEPELSMHIDWQRRLVSSMRLLNPIGQMILATHSPEIMAEISDDQIYRI
jgi:predicted ATPase